MNKFSKHYFAFLIVLIFSLNGCTSTGISILEKNNHQNTRSIAFSETQFKENYELKNFGFYAGHLQMMVRPFMLGRGVGVLIPHIDTVQYYPSDSTIYLKGKLLNWEDRNVISAQILFCVEHIDTSLGEQQRRLIVHDQYIINKSGFYEVFHKVRKPEILLFAPHEIYSRDGKYQGVELNATRAYDISKLLLLY